MKLKIKPGEPILVFVRIKGKNGVRELRAVIDTGSQYSVISVQDARRLGYDAYYDALTDPGAGTRGLTQAGIIEVDKISLEEVSIGELAAKDVKTLAFELPKFGRTEAILGLSFLEHFKTTIDFKQGFLTLEPA